MLKESISLLHSENKSIDQIYNEILYKLFITRKILLDREQLVVEKAMLITALKNITWVETQIYEELYTKGEMLKLEKMITELLTSL